LTFLVYTIMAPYAHSPVTSTFPNKDISFLLLLLLLLLLIIIILLLLLTYLLQLGFHPVAVVLH
jgi:hypothetical protein